ncbi:hypothetical protein BUALT_Bualt02G0005800 [Buddleja alternifolia]|uniref:UDP-glycosyltransferase n=1 Tax=Buddleja alternifolia TaxID=168488 RepID=A0AAV6XXY1_9LAMI|nr:hypothetical protein BUALT_Bualt02G0005800 [Buddleja alternifolia]
MAPTEITHPIRDCHVVAVPYPGRGHVNAMMNLCKLLTNSKPNLRITFVVTEEWLGLIGSEEKPPSIRFETIPNVVPSELARAADMVTFMGATQTKMAEPFERLLDRLQAPADIIIADTFLNWAVEVGNRRNIPVASLWPMPATVFSVFYHFDLLVRNGDHPFDVSAFNIDNTFPTVTDYDARVNAHVVERGEERLDYIPGIPSIRLVDIPSIAYIKDQGLIRVTLQNFPYVSKAQYLLITSVYELEPQVIEALKQEFSFPIYAFGPAIPYSNLEKATSLSTNIQNDLYFEWLNSQPPSSVLYIAFGSFLSVSSAQMDEIAAGLHKSGVRFLWVARGEAERLQEKCGNAGKVVPWCEQLKVLSHNSIGGFWTHCGWNSTIESIFSGVPLIAFPLSLDQTTTRKLIVEDWKIGCDGKRGVGPDGMLRSEEISKLVKKFMDFESIERKEMMRMVKKLQNETLKSISDGGLSKANFNSFLDDITSFNMQQVLYKYEVEQGEERVNYISGIPSICLVNIPSIAYTKDQGLLHLTRQLPKCIKGTISIVYFYLESEHQVIEALKHEFSFPIHNLGPTMPYFNLEKASSFSTNIQTDDRYFEWLNSQPSSSTSSAQMDDTADGLHESGVRFLWVARRGAERLQEKCGDARKVVR